MDDYLQHYGIPGQKHGVRRYQHPDGSLTALGKLRYSKSYMRSKAFRKSRSKNMGKSYIQKRKDQQSKRSEEKAKAKAATRRKKQQTSKKFIKTVGKDIVVPAVIVGSKDALTTFVRNHVGTLLGNDDYKGGRK